MDEGSLHVTLQQWVDTLLEETRADRTTLRLDLPRHDLNVDLAAAEATRPGVRAIRHDSGLDQRALNTVVWLENNRRILVQPDFRAEPYPPQALIEHYGVRAQMLGPVVVDDVLVGWFSAHSITERGWSKAETAALTTLCSRAQDHLSPFFDGPEPKA
jgi:maleate isomerase